MIDIPDPVRDHDDDGGPDDGGPDDGGPGGGDDRGNTISGNNGSNGNGGGKPNPTFSLPEGFIQGQNGTGGRRH